MSLFLDSSEHAKIWKQYFGFITKRKLNLSSGNYEQVVHLHANPESHSSIL